MNPNTIKSAVATRTAVPTQSPKSNTSRDNIRRIRTKEEIVAEMNEEFALICVGPKVMILRERKMSPRLQDRRTFMTLPHFKTLVANRASMVATSDGARWEKHDKMWLNSPERRQFEGYEFHPNPDGDPNTPGYLNSYSGFSVTPDSAPASERRKKYSTFYDHIRTNICAENEEHCAWIWAWLATMIQRPRERTGTAIVLRGKMGTGKSKFGEQIGKLFEEHYFNVDEARYVTGQFNAHMASCLLLQVDEGVWAGDKSAEGRLKGLVTADVQMIEQKGVDPIRMRNFVRLIFTSNEGWVVPAGPNERRFAVFDVAPHVAQNLEYFAELDKQMDSGGREALLADLLAYDLNALGAPNPRVIPRTKALLDQKRNTLDSMHKWWSHRLLEGSQTLRHDDWTDIVPVASLHTDFLRYAAKMGHKWPDDDQEMTRKLKQVVPGLLGVRKRIDVDNYDDAGTPRSTHKQARCLKFPNLATCRTGFDKFMMQPMDWEEEELDERSIDAGGNT
jgi:hypothetical protein